MNIKKTGLPFRAVSISQHTAPIELRELFHLQQADYPPFLSKLREVLGISEALILSTCNRTEVYYLSETDYYEEIIKLLQIEKGITGKRNLLPFFQNFSQQERTIEYLFRVSIGLESHVLGDLQISSQVKHAYKYCHEASMADAFLHRLMHTIFHAHKRVQQETAFRDGAASVSYAASELAISQTRSLLDPKVLVLGTGEMGSDVSRHLAKKENVSLSIANRTHTSALALQEELNKENVSVESFPMVFDQLGNYDCVISTISGESPLILPEHFHHSEKQQVLIDLSVPRSISEEIDDLEKVQVFNIDDIQILTEKAVEKRKACIPAVETIIRSEIEGFFDWQQQLNISPTIHKIKNALESIRKEELARFLKHANEKESKLLEEFSTSMMNKVLRVPILQLKEACRRGNPEDLIDVLNDLFDLEGARKKYQAAKEKKG